MGQKKAIEEGMKEEKQRLAQNMLNMNMDIETIKEVTKITDEQIKQSQKEPSIPITRPCLDIYQTEFRVSMILCPIPSIYRTNFPNFTILCPIPSVYRTKFLLSAFLCPIPSIYR